jgi:hypothetical protein
VFRVTVFWNAFLGFHGPPVRSARFDKITYVDKTPNYTPLRVLPVVTSIEGNVFDVERDTPPVGNVRCVGRHPDTGEERASEFTIANGANRTIVV